MFPWSQLTSRDVSLWKRQTLAVLRLDLRRYLWGARGTWLAILALAPALITALHSVRVAVRHEACGIERDTVLIAELYQFYYLRLGIFFGTLGPFVRMLRGEMVDRTMHYYLIAPVRRELLILGKFLAGSLGTASVFALGGVLTFFAAYAHHDFAQIASFLGEVGLYHLGAYMGLTLLACVGYSAVFLVSSLSFKNPVLAAIVFLGWESINGMLPAALQLLSVTYYLKPLFPVAVPVVGISGLFTVVVEPIPRSLAVFGLFALSTMAVIGACLRFRRVELD